MIKEISIILMLAIPTYAQLQFGSGTNITATVMNANTIAAWVSTNNSDWHHYASNSIGRFVDGVTNTWSFVPWTYNGTNLVAGNTNCYVDALTVRTNVLTAAQLAHYIRDTARKYNYPLSVSTNLLAIAERWDYSAGSAGCLRAWDTENVGVAGGVALSTNAVIRDRSSHASDATANGAPVHVLPDRAWNWATATGGTVTNYTDTSGIAWTAHIFTTVGTNTLTVTSGGEVEYLVVGGGGCGGGGNNNTGGGGGGGGGVIPGTTNIAGGSYAITVGRGWSTDPTLGSHSSSNSAAFGMSAAGGDRAAGRISETYLSAASPPSGSGGSGGGSGYGNLGRSLTTAVAPALGNNGGVGIGSGKYPGGGGGGAGSVGSNAVNDASGGNGGTGYTSSIAGVSAAYGGGGGAGVYGGTAGVGSGGGGNGSGASPTGNGAAGTASTGGGGGGGSGSASTSGLGGAGGSGIVVIRYRRAR